MWKRNARVSFLKIFRDKAGADFFVWDNFLGISSILGKKKNYNHGKNCNEVLRWIESRLGLEGSKA